MNRSWLFRLVWLTGVALAVSACGDDTSASSTSSSTTTTVSTSSTTSSTTTSVPASAVDGDCPTAYGRAAFIELFDTGELPCLRVAGYQEFVVVNRTSEPVELTWDGSPVPIPINEVFQARPISDHLDVGVHKIPTNRSPITIEVVDPATSSFTDEPMVLRRWGNIRPGDTISDAEARMGATIFIPPDESGAGRDFCTYGFVENDPYSPGIMIHDLTEIVRLDAYAPQHQTASGIRIGSTTDEVLTTYGEKIERSPHEYVTDGEYLTFVPVDSIDADFRVVFETNENGIVTTFRNGLAGPASWVEGCL